MLGRGDETACDGIVVQILELLQHYRVAEHGLRMIAFLPELKLRLRLVAGAPRPQQKSAMTRGRSGAVRTACR